VLRLELSVKTNALVGDISSTLSELILTATSIFQVKLSATLEENAITTANHLDCL
jgi:hypothetical protein